MCLKNVSFILWKKTKHNFWSTRIHKNLYSSMEMRKPWPNPWSFFSLKNSGQGVGGEGGQEILKEQVALCQEARQMVAHSSTKWMSCTFCPPKSNMNFAAQSWPFSSLELACYSFMNTGQRHAPPESDTKSFIIHGTAGSWAQWSHWFLMSLKSQGVT